MESEINKVMSWIASRKKVCSSCGITYYRNRDHKYSKYNEYDDEAISNVVLMTNKGRVFKNCNLCDGCIRKILSMLNEGKEVYL